MYRCFLLHCIRRLDTSTVDLLIVEQDWEMNQYSNKHHTYNCFQWLDAPVEVTGALNLPAVPMNTALEAAMLPNAEKIKQKIGLLLNT